MNRKKKINQILAKRLKKARSKNAVESGNTKPRYISKAERAKLELESTSDQPESGSPEAGTPESGTPENSEA